MQRIVALLALATVSSLVVAYPLLSASAQISEHNRSSSSSYAGEPDISGKILEYPGATGTAAKEVSPLQGSVQTYSGNDSSVTVISNHTSGTAEFIPLIKYEPSFKVINITSSEGNISNPEIAASGKNVYIIYNNDEEGKLDVFVTLSRDHGVTYDPPRMLSMNLTGNSTNYEIGAAGDIAYAIFENAGAGNGDIFYAVTFDAGKTWAVYNISNSPSPSYDSTLNVDEKGESYIAWVENDNSTSLRAYCVRWCW